MTCVLCDDYHEIGVLAERDRIIKLLEQEIKELTSIDYPTDDSEPSRVAFYRVTTLKFVLQLIKMEIK